MFRTSFIRHRKKEQICTDMIQVYKILNDIDNVNKDKLFTMSHSIGNRGHQIRYTRIDTDKLRGKYFSKMVCDLWNELPENSFGTYL